MAETAPAPHSDLVALRDRLAEPQPVCLGLLTIEAAVPDSAPPSWTPPRPDVRARLDQILRPYDLYHPLDQHHAILLPTLADATTLSNRLGQVFQAVAAPYEIDGRAVAVRTMLGAAVRHPQDDVDAFLERAGGAMQAAWAAGGQGPVLV